ncbi:1-hydroxycarotenoid 3,4-desaturase CrtD [Pseudosulfitobacter koreensis]|uniref:FAD-dependent oxidoreductase n=1 Tax=Pseudosulfitobacter koreensis TaxID=2968472 RepID=A0ABT1YWG6_9RHOB|nr:1-hydroxycarotenoid 3,4-desaturase CrtD [Pseudosulfitobacter koreense]MCR8825226.1 FAD-dependent oxidoreductase [Pseudosulfitobacter koreense]
MSDAAPHVAIVGAGIGGLAAALRLAHRGVRVTVLERHGTPGGKMRTLPTVAGPVDAGPTVLTMKPVFEALFADVGTRLDDHVTLDAQTILARHFWPDGTRLDLMHDPDASLRNVADVFGPRSASEFASFSEKARTLFEAFDAPMMQSAAPTSAALTLEVAKNPKLIRHITPHLSLMQSLSRHFTDPRLAQLFARYATYVGGLPALSPALLSLIWHAERMGVWHVRGGMIELARSIAKLATSFGATFHYDTHVTRVELQAGQACAVYTATGRISVDAVLFNGDPAALHLGLLGDAVKPAVTPEATRPRSLSACVMSFAAKPQGVALSGHNVFFSGDPKSEYGPLAQGRMQTDPTLYVCAQDRLSGDRPDGQERFEIILNCPPIDRPDPEHDKKARTICHTLILKRLRHLGLTFTPQPGPETLTTPQGFDSLYPGSAGALYGRSPHGMMAAFKRPTVRTAIPGIYLVGGGVHPGPGVPMATLCARHAAEAILNDLPSISRFRPADTHGGTSTVSATTARAPSRSSAS